MFRVVTPETVTATARVRPPQGRPADVTLILRYRGMAESVRYAEQVGEEGVEDLQVIEETVVDWRGVQDADGQPIEWHDHEARRAALDVPWLWAAVRDAVIDEIFHRGAARKN